MSLTLIGDPKQVLYSFRGASPEYLDRMPDLFTRKVTPLELLTNYRSPQQLVMLSNYIAETFSKVKNVQPSVPHLPVMSGILTLMEFEDTYKEFSYVAKTIKKENEANGIPYKTMTVLSRTNKALTDMEASLVANEIPYTIKYDSRSLSRQSGFKFFYDVFSIILNPRDINAIEELAYCIKGMGPKTVAQLVSQIKTFFKVNPAKSINSLTYDSVQIRSKAVLDFFSLMDKLVKPTAILFKMGESGIFEVMAALSNSINVHCELAKSKYEAGEHQSEQEQTPAKANALHLDFDEYAYDKSLRTLRSIYQIMLEDRQFATLPKSEQFLEFYSSLQISQDLGEDKDQKKDSVTLSTIHGAKGLQNDLIFFCNINPSKSYTATELEDERCAFYVAVTRAKRRMYLTTSYAAPSYDGRMRSTVPSPFLSTYLVGIQRMKKELGQ